MPILGAFVWGLILGIGRMLVWVAARWGGTIVANLCLALGVSFLSVKFGAPAFEGIFNSGFSQLPANLASLLRYLGVYEAASILVGAALFKVGKGVVTGIVAKGAAK